MWPFTATETVLIITTVFGGIAATIAALRGQTSIRMQDTLREKISEVHDITNANLAKIKRELQQTKSALSISRAANKEFDHQKEDL